MEEVRSGKLRSTDVEVSLGQTTKSSVEPVFAYSISRLQSYLCQTAPVQPSPLPMNQTPSRNPYARKTPLGDG